METNPIVWFEIYVQDMDRAVKFYEAVLGVQLEKLDTPAPDIEMMAFPMQMGLPGAAGALAKMKDVPSGGMGTMVYFSCQDCAVEESRVVAAGGSVQKSKMSIGPYGFISIVSDTEGNMIGLHSK